LKNRVLTNIPLVSDCPGNRGTVTHGAPSSANRVASLTFYQVHQGEIGQFVPIRPLSTFIVNVLIWFSWLDAPDYHAGGLSPGNECAAHKYFSLQSPCRHLFDVVSHPLKQHKLRNSIRGKTLHLPSILAACADVEKPGTFSVRTQAINTMNETIKNFCDNRSFL